MQRVRVSSVVLCAVLHLFGLNGCGSPDSSGSGAAVTHVGGSGAHSSSSTSSPPGSSAGGSNGYIVDSTGGSSCVRTNGSAPPGCGDGIVQADRGEQCDDGNTVAGDGCSGTCQIEPNHTCPPRGGRCEVSFRCGDGVVNPGEACDEGDFQGQPGCSSDCTEQSPGYNCVPGQACVPLFTCGNNRIEQGETCDPPNPGNGCSLDCQTEDGWRCQPGSCTRLPYCGDGIIQASLGEVCDQGASQGQPGCSADCKTQDSSCTCLPGKACTCQSPVCGDGIIQTGEQCDQGSAHYPGCEANCHIEAGYKCPFAGAPCVPVCGDGILVSPSEQCDPGMNLDHVKDACNADCTIKPGWACDTSGCHQTKCGDGKVEGSEGCDSLPFNNDLGDGCTPLCTAEPNCPAGGGACTTTCGDGLVMGNEECDDGNAVSGDGCSATCQVEPGYQCEQPPLGDTMLVPMVVRDFNAGGDFEKGSSFATGLNYANQGLVKPLLDNGLKPALAATSGTYNGKAGQDSGIASAASFAQFYNDAAPAAGNSYNTTLATTLTLYLESDGSAYVNRFGNNGDGLTNAQYQRTHTNQCGTTTQSNHDADGNAIPCTACYYNANDPLNLTPCTQDDATPCQTDATYTGQCVAKGTAWLGTFLDASFDGNPLFFPADAISKPWSPNSEAQISGNYDPSWPADPTGKTHNFSFTTEVRFWFKYEASKNYQLTFVGDDDVWVFINKHLAVDLGGIHTAVQGSLTFGKSGSPTTVVTPTNVTPATGTTSHPNLGTLVDGSVYEIAVFQVERQTKASSYQLSLSGFNAAHSVCKPICGGSKPGVSPGQECNNGDAGNCDASQSDCYNQCTTKCTLGPRCGDGVLQSSHEQCDNGVNTDVYGATGTSACAPGCVLPPFCGDGHIQMDYGEACDDGTGNSDDLYNGCTTKCTLGPYCGDGIVNGDGDHAEACDDGVNDGTYGTCGIGCTLPPRCGDGIVQEDWGEQCEPTSADDPNCTSSCKLPGSCGDGVVQEALGEQCDYGAAKNTGEYGGCNSNCTLAPYCGDGVTNGPEECDLGKALNVGAYGGCTATCQLGPHCGDGIVNGSEDCDDGSPSTASASTDALPSTDSCSSATGNGSSNSRCTTSCQWYEPSTT